MFRHSQEQFITEDVIENMFDSGTWPRSPNGFRA